MRLAYFLILLFLSKFIEAQLVVTNGASPTALVNSLLGSGISVSNVTFQGVYNLSSKYQIGSFSTTGSVQTNLGFASGIVLSTGNTSDIPLSPLTSDPGAVSQISTGYVDCSNGEVRKTGTCPTIINDLAVLSGATNYFNAAILEFDFVPINTNISFSYVFGSEEYDDRSGAFGINYNCSSYNDKFGFIISGPGISGGQGYSNNGKNIARLSNGSEVSINSVNDGVVGSSGGSPSASNCQAANPAWVNNVATSEFKGIIYGINFNGNTKVLTATQSGLTAGSVYHIKIIVTDLKDAAYDSGVFLGAGSFTSPTTLPIDLIDFRAFCDDKGIELNWQTSTEKDNQSFMIERSEDGINFFTIGEIPGSVSTEKVQYYYFNDISPNLGINYYRLKQQDLDGKITIFNTISVEANCSKDQDVTFSLFPNPADKNLFVDFNLGNNSYITFEICNSMGQIVKTIPNKHFDKGFQKMSIDVSTLSSGVYYFKSHFNEKIKVMKFIKL